MATCQGPLTPRVTQLWIQQACSFISSDNVTQGATYSFRNAITSISDDHVTHCRVLRTHVFDGRPYSNIHGKYTHMQKYIGGRQHSKT